MTTQVSKGTLPYEHEQKVLKKLQRMNREIDLLRRQLDGWDIVGGREISRAASHFAHNLECLSSETR